MTSDHLDSFMEAIDKEGVPFLVAVPKGDFDKRGFRVICRCVGVSMGGDVLDDVRDMRKHINRFFDDWERELLGIE